MDHPRLAEKTDENGDIVLPPDDVQDFVSIQICKPDWREINGSKKDETPEERELYDENKWKYIKSMKLNVPRYQRLIHQLQKTNSAFSNVKLNKEFIEAMKDEKRDWMNAEKYLKNCVSVVAMSPDDELEELLGAKNGAATSTDHAVKNGERDMNWDGSVNVNPAEHVHIE